MKSQTLYIMLLMRKSEYIARGGGTGPVQVNRDR